MGFFTICRGSISTEGKGRFHCKSVLYSEFREENHKLEIRRVVNYAHRIPEDGFRRRMAVEADTDRCRPRSEKYS